MIFTDSHAHLSLVAKELGTEALSALLSGYADAEAAALREGRISPIILDPGTEPNDLPGRVSLLRGLCARIPGDRPSPEAGGLSCGFLRFAAGIWPSPENLASPKASLAALEQALSSAASGGLGERVVAIGEGGLDYHYEEGLENGLKRAQGELFEGQLALASRLGLPMIVHSRESYADTLSFLRELKPSRPVIIHCFGYGPDEARAFLDLGCYISFAGNITYKKSEAQREACILVPPERLLLETDSPYMNPMPRRGHPASPLDVERSYEFAAALRGIAVEELAESVSRNARELFG
jgi:TatD DNase family protein